MPFFSHRDRKLIHNTAVYTDKFVFCLLGKFCYLDKIHIKAKKLPGNIGGQYLDGGGGRKTGRIWYIAKIYNIHPRIHRVTRIAHHL